MPKKNLFSLLRDFPNRERAKEKEAKIRLVRTTRWLIENWDFIKECHDETNNNSKI